VLEGRTAGPPGSASFTAAFCDDGWDDEYDALNEGDFMYLQLLVS
jgi:hypothetical protein